MTDLSGKPSGEKAASHSSMVASAGSANTTIVHEEPRRPDQKLTTKAKATSSTSPSNGSQQKTKAEGSHALRQYIEQASSDEPWYPKTQDQALKEGSEQASLRSTKPTAKEN